MQTDATYRIPARDDRPAFDENAHRVACGTSGVWHVRQWLNTVEEASLISAIDTEHKHDWTRLRDRRLLHLGGSPCDALGRGIELEPLPVRSLSRSLCAGVGAGTLRRACSARCL